MLDCTCHNHSARDFHNPTVVFNRILRSDPTRTTVIRNKFIADLTGRFRALQRVIRISVVNNDCFGLKKDTSGLPGVAVREFLVQAKEDMSPTRPNEFAFESDAKKINGFMGWLQRQEDLGILEIQPGEQIGEAINDAWTNTYITSAYQKGIQRGRQELENAGYETIPIDEDVGGIRPAFLSSFHADRVGVAYGRTFRGLNKITKEMDGQISEVLATGLAEGRNPLEIARTLNDRVDKIGMTRARTLARTEVVRAHHSATIQEYRNAGAEGVTILAEFATAGDAFVCERCKAIERGSGPYTPVTRRPDETGTTREFQRTGVKRKKKKEEPVARSVKPKGWDKQKPMSRQERLKKFAGMKEQRDELIKRGLPKDFVKSLKGKDVREILTDPKNLDNYIKGGVPETIKKPKKKSVETVTKRKTLKQSWGSLPDSKKDSLHKALRTYTSSDYVKMRKAELNKPFKAEEFFRDTTKYSKGKSIEVQNVTGYDDKSDYKKAIKEINSFIDSQKSYSGTVYRGMGFHRKKGVIDKFLKGIEDNDGIYEFPTLTSTGTKKGTAKTFALDRALDNGELIVMEIGKTKSGLDIHKVPNKRKGGVEYKQLPRQNEILFKGGSQFKVTGYRIGKVDGNRTLFINMEEV